MEEETAETTTLETAVENNSEEKIINLLKSLLADTKNIDFKDIPLITKLLDSKNTEILRLTSQAIAESAKTSENREQLTNSDIIKSLLSLLDNSDVLCLTQICRALGNLCYENDKARQIVTQLDGLKKLLNAIEVNLDSKNSQVINITCGFLLNYLSTNESAQKSALDLNILNLIENVINYKLDTFATNEDLFTHLLLLLSSLTENMIDSWFSNELCLQIVKILECSVNPEISELCLELLHNQGENDDIKFVLAKSGLCELLFRLLEEHKSLVQDDEGRALMKLACDLIVLILTGDESMTYLYDNGNGIVYKNMLSWLESDDIDLLITGVLAMGNFARNDSHCIKMVQSGLSETLLGILSEQNKSDDDIRLQHALLSALRNLVIPVENKTRVIKSGLIDIIYPLLTTEQQPVVFKLLGTLRMVIDGQEETALQLAMRADLLEKLVHWCFNSDHPGVRAESPRLLSWLIKHCRSSKPYPVMIQVNDCIKCLVEMIPSSHAVMQNEALLALNLLCVTCLNDESTNLNDYQKLDVITNDNSSTNTIISEENKINEKQDPTFPDKLISSDIGKYINFLLSKYGDKMEKEVFANLLTLLEYLVCLPKIKDHLKESKIPEALKKGLERESFKIYTERINKVSCSIDSG